MILVKSKINFLACLKSAIYISIVGGVILSSKPAASASFTIPPKDTDTSLTISLQDLQFGNNNSQIINHGGAGKYWNANLTITEEEGNLGGTDVLILRGVVQHIFAKHPGETSAGPLLTFEYRLLASAYGGSHTPPLVRTPHSPHSGGNHWDSVIATLSANLTHGAVGQGHDIQKWNFDMTATHGVPEPLTILAAGASLGFGVLFKKTRC